MAEGADLPLHRLTATALRDRIASGAVSAEEVTRHFLGRIEKHDPAIHAFLHVDAEGAIRAAKECDARRARGEPARLLEGVPIAVKDNIHVEGLPTTCASRVLAGFRAPRDATAVARLRAAGAVPLGKTNLDEFAMGSSTENSAYGPTKNPWNAERVPGGSSGGSAAAVAAGLAPLAFGSDTGGSIRQPAAMCGVVGLKPTYGRVSRSGLVAFGSSLDQVGPLSRGVRDSAAALEVLAGRDPLDSTSLSIEAPSAAAADIPVKGLRVGVCLEQIEHPGLEAGVKYAVERSLAALQSAGADVRPVSLPHAADGIAVYYVVATSEASSNLARFDGVRYGLRAEGADLAAVYDETRDRGFGTEVKRRILLGTFALSAGYADAYYQRALRVRRLIADDYEKAFKQVDVVVGPTAPTTAFPLGSRTADPLAMYLSDIFSVPANLAGIPAISVPCGKDSAGLPVGLHVQAAPLREDAALRVALLAEEKSGSREWLPEAFA
jgi:aspartyl-tRNA(Asn)/glutamyl-tRNA(Gln) amidotransferase subunit A